MNVLVIDNIDSFVYNLVQYVGICGANPIVLQNTCGFDRVRDAIEEHDIERIIISPGPKRPQDAGVSNQTILEYGPKIPTLGVCLGHQCIGYVFGSVIIHAKRLMHGKTSLITHDGSSLFKGLPNPFVATRYHSLAIDEDNISGDLIISARTEDDQQIMAVRHKKHPIYGVQFHPESIQTVEGMKIIKNFVGEI